MMPKTDDIHPPKTGILLGDTIFIIYLADYIIPKMSYNNNTKKLKHYELY